MSDDRLSKIFDLKRKSSLEFRTIQARHGLIPVTDLLLADPHTREGTHELHKGIHWINLELSEFIQAGKDEQPEELADVLHFLVEFTMLAGYTYKVIPLAGNDDRIGWDRLDIMLLASQNDAFVFPDAHTNARFTILAALMVAELLKNKPWKQTLKPLDRTEFETRIRGMFYWYGATVRTAGLDAAQLYAEYVRKDEINHNRATTGV
jgi:hypothetical protein